MKTLFAVFFGGLLFAVIALTAFSFADTLDYNWEHYVAENMEISNEKQQESENQWAVCPYHAGTVKAEICLRNKWFNKQELPSVLLD